MNIGFVLVSYGLDEPAGMERSVASLVNGFVSLGQQAYVIAAGPVRSRDGPGIVRLKSLELHLPASDEVLLSTAEASCDLAEELDTIASALNLDILCWVDSLWGLGFLGHPRGRLRTVLMVHVLGEKSTPLDRALRHYPDVIIAPSTFIITQQIKRNQPADHWKVVPNCLLEPLHAVPSDAERRRLRREGPIRVVARLGVEKGVLPLIEYSTNDLGRPLEIVLAEAGFEASTGSQRLLKSACKQASVNRSWVRILEPLRWLEVPAFLAQASVTIVPSLTESFGLVTLESMSVGTPVVAFDVGNLPSLLRQGGGVLVKSTEGIDGLWRAARFLLTDEESYYLSSTYAVLTAQNYRSSIVAKQWLEAALS